MDWTQIVDALSLLMQVASVLFIAYGFVLAVVSTLPEALFRRVMRPSRARGTRSPGYVADPTA